MGQVLLIGKEIIQLWESTILLELYILPNQKIIFEIGYPFCDMLYLPLSLGGDVISQILLKCSHFYAWCLVVAL